MSRLTLIALAGSVAIGGGLYLRSTPWARERQLKSLSVEELALVIHDRPRDPLVFNYYGGALLKAGKMQDAEQAFRHAVQLDSRNDAAHVGIGSVLLRSGNPYAAAPAFEEAVKLKPDSVPARLGAAQAYYQMGSASRALPHLEKIVQVEPKRAVAWYYLAKLYGERSQSDKALDAMTHAVQLEPTNAESWRDLGQLQRHYSQLTEAETSFKKAIELNAKDYTAHYWLGQLYSGMGPGKSKAAEQSFRRAIALDPDLAEVYFELGQIYERRGEWSKAAEQYRMARQKGPTLSRPIYNLGICLIKLGQEAEGRKLLKGFQALTRAKQEIEGTENRLRAAPENAPLTLRMARIYRKYGNDEGAIALYDRYLKLAPTDKAARTEIEGYRERLRQRASAAAKPGR